MGSNFLYFAMIAALALGAQLLHAQEKELFELPTGVGTEFIRQLEDTAVPEPKVPDRPLSKKVQDAVVNSVANVTAELGKESASDLRERTTEEKSRAESERILSFVRNLEPTESFRRKYAPICRNERLRKQILRTEMNEIRSFLYRQSARLSSVIASVRNSKLAVESKWKDLEKKRNDPFFKSEVYNAWPTTVELQVNGDSSPLDPLTISLQRASLDLEWTAKLVDLYYRDMTGEGTYIYDGTVGGFCYDALPGYESAMIPDKIQRWRPVDVADCTPEQKERLRSGLRLRVPWKFIAIAAAETQIIRFAIIRPIIARVQVARAGLGPVVTAANAPIGTRVVTSVMRLNKNLFPTPCYHWTTLRLCTIGLGLVEKTINLSGSALALGGKVISFLVPTGAAYDFVSNRFLPWFNFIVNNYGRAQIALGNAYDLLGSYYEQAVDYCYYRSCLESSAKIQSLKEKEFEDYLVNLKSDESATYCRQGLPQNLREVRRSEFGKAFQTRISEAVSSLLVSIGGSPFKNTMTELIVRLDEINLEKLDSWFFARTKFQPALRIQTGGPK